MARRRGLPSGTSDLSPDRKMAADTSARQTVLCSGHSVQHGDSRPCAETALVSAIWGISRAAVPICESSTPSPTDEILIKQPHSLSGRAPQSSRCYYQCLFTYPLFDERVKLPVVDWTSSTSESDTRQEDPCRIDSKRIGHKFTDTSLTQISWQWLINSSQISKTPSYSWLH